jgi:energy-coupling factor transporter transmembrane protein EcfT
MRILAITVSIITALLGLALSILPFGSIAFIPIVLSFIFGLIAFKVSKKEGKSNSIIKIFFFVTVISLGLSIYNTLRPDEIIEDTESIEAENISDEDMEELEAIEIED